MFKTQMALEGKRTTVATVVHVMDDYSKSFLRPMKWDEEADDM